MEQTKAQEVTLKKATEGPSAGDGKKEKERRALVKAGEIPIIIPSPTSNEVQEAPQSRQCLQGPYFAVRNSFVAHYSPIASQT